MIIDQPGRVTDRITLLGRRESCVYLVDGGGSWAVLGGGMTYIIPDLLAQMKELGVDETRIERWVIHHTHFDHIGVIPFFKKRWPWIQVTVSRRGQDVLSRPEVVKSIVDLNRMLLAREGLAERAGELGLDDPVFPVDEAMDDGQVVRLGDLSLEFIAAPGHSSCSMAVYIPEEKALSASDAGGIPFGGHVFSAANSNFDQYQQSLEKMARYDVAAYLAEHYGALTGDEGRTFLRKSMASAEETRRLIEEVYARSRTEHEAVEEIVDRLSADASGYFLPREIMTMVVSQMIRYVAKQSRRS